MSARARPNPGLVLGIVAGATALVLGIGLTEAPGAVLPLTLELLLLGVVTWAVVLRERDAASRRWLGRVVAGALFVRILALLWVHFSFSPYFFAPDAWGYERLGRELVSYFFGSGPYPEELKTGFQVAYPYINGFFQLLFGDAALGAAVFNLFAGLWTVILAYYLGREVLGEKVARIAALLTAFFPSLVLWSVLNIRDALTTALVTFIVLLGVRAYRHFRFGEVILLLGAIVVLGTFRDYMAFLAVSGLLLGFATAARPGQMGRTLVTGTVLILFMVFVAEDLGLFRTIALEDPLETAAQYRLGLQHDAASAYGEGYDTSTLGGALRFLPVGLTYILFAPFPWAIRSVLQMTTLPEVLLWYAIFPFSLIGLRYAVTKGERQNLILVGVLLSIVVTYALVEGNFGTAYRHRAQIMPLFFVLAGAGVVLFRTHWIGRERTTASRMGGRHVPPLVEPRPATALGPPDDPDGAQRTSGASGVQPTSGAESPGAGSH